MTRIEDALLFYIISTSRAHYLSSSSDFIYPTSSEIKTSKVPGLKHLSHSQFYSLRRVNIKAIDQSYQIEQELLLQKPKS